MKQIIRGYNAISIALAQGLQRYGVTVSLIVVLALAFYLRATGAPWGLPYIWSWDEKFIVNPAIHIAHTGDYNPRWFCYPSLCIYMQLIVFILFYYYMMATGRVGPYGLTEITYSSWPWEISHPELYLWGRILTVLLGTATVYLVYRVGAQLFDRPTGLLAASFLALAGGHIDQSRFILTNVPAAFFTAWAFLLICKLQDRRSRHIDYALAGLVAGLAVSTKYNAFPIVVALLIAHALRPNRRVLLDSNLLMGMAGVAFGFLLGTPYAILDLPTFLTSTGQELQRYRLGRGGYTGPDAWRYYLTWLADKGVGSRVLGLSLLGSAVGFVQNWRKQLLILSFPILEFCLLCNQGKIYSRNLMPVFPFVALLAAVALTHGIAPLVQRLARTRLKTVVAAAAVGLIVLSVFYPYPWNLFTSDFYTRTRTLPTDTRLRAARWINENLPAGARLAVAEELHFYLPSISEEKFAVESIAHAGESPLDLFDRGVQYVVTGRYESDSSQQTTLYADFYNGATPVKVFKGGAIVPGRRRPIQNPEVHILALDDPTALAGAALLRIRSDTVTVIDFGAMEKTKPYKMRGGFLAMPWSGKILQVTQIEPGAYRVKMQATGTPVKGIFPRVLLTWKQLADNSPLTMTAGEFHVLAERLIGEFDVDGSQGDTYLSNPVEVPAQQVVVLELAFINDKREGGEDRNVKLYSLEIVPVHQSAR